MLLHHGGSYWNFPKGHIEKGESDWVAAWRETREETGLKLIRPVLGFKRYEKYFIRRKEKFAFKLVIYFLAEASGRERVRVSHEHENFGWFSFREASQKAKYKESRRLLEEVRAFLPFGLNPLARKIYQLTRKIPKGRVGTYGAIAGACGKPTGSRFVGAVLNKNSDPSIPCHRVVASDGSIGGYNKGMNKKIALLKKEGVVIKNNRVDLERYGYQNYS